MLLVPAVHLKQGTGHLKRSLFLVEVLERLKVPGEKGERPGEKTYLYIPPDPAVADTLRTVLNGEKNIIRHLDRKKKWDLVILDKKITTRKELNIFFHADAVAIR